MARFTIAAPDVVSEFKYEAEGLRGMDVAFVRVPYGSEDEFIDAARQADAIYVNKVKVTRRVLERLDRCRAVALQSIGLDNVDLAAATECGVRVTYVPDTFVEEVADHAFALLFAQWRQIIAQDRLVREGRWREGRPILNAVPRLWGLTLGLVAFGNVAQAVALRAKPFGLRVIAHDPYVRDTAMIALGVEPVTLDELMQRSDLISMHAPWTAETEKMLGEAQFAQVKLGAIFVNTGRGATVDEAALVRALRDGRLAGAALDVLEQEPPDIDNPMLAMKNVTLSGHVASASARFDPVRKRRVGQELAAALCGRPPVGCANPAVLGRERRVS